MRRIGRADPWDSSEALLSIELAKGDSLASAILLYNASSARQ